MSEVSRVPIAILIAQCAGRRRADGAWRLLVDRLEPGVRGAVLGALDLCGRRADPDLVAELVQEVWCRLLERDRRALARCRGGGERVVVGYVRRIAAGVTIDSIRAEAARKRGPRRMLSLDEESLGDRATGDRRCCPERRLLARERAERLVALCRELLGPRRRAERLAIVRMAWLEGMSSREIVASVPGRWTVTAVNSLLHRLRRGLQAHGIRPPRRTAEKIRTAGLPPWRAGAGPLGTVRLGGE